MGVRSDFSQPVPHRTVAAEQAGRHRLADNVDLWGGRGVALVEYAPRRGHGVAFLAVALFCLVVAKAFGISYSYDALNRLTNVDYGKGTVISYTYDAAGNRLTQNISVGVQSLAPTITSGTPSVGVVGQAYNFTFTATGSPVLTFSVATGALPAGLALGADGLLSGTPTQAGSYTFTVQVANGVDPATTQSVALTITTAAQAPLIIGQPASVTAFQGTTATLTAATNGSGLAYQWQKNGVMINGATNATYTINNAQSGDAGNYTVVVSKAIATGLDGPAQLVLDGSTLFFADSGGSAIKAVDINGGTVTTLYTGLTLNDSGASRGIGRLQVDGDNLYGDYGGYVSMNIFTAAKAGGSISTLAPNSGGDFIGVIGGNLYYGNGFNYLYSMPKAGVSATNLLSGYWIRNVAFDASAIYFCDYYTKDVKKYALSGGQLSTLVSGNSGEVGVFIDAANLYYNLNGNIRKVARDWRGGDCFGRKRHSRRLCF